MPKKLSISLLTWQGQGDSNNPTESMDELSSNTCTDREQRMTLHGTSSNRRELPRKRIDWAAYHDGQTRIYQRALAELEECSGPKVERDLAGLREAFSIHLRCHPKRSISEAAKGFFGPW